jgi:hypothetical protein
MNFRNLRSPVLHASAFSIFGLLFISCGKTMTGTGSLSRTLESRPPMAGETNGRPVITEDTFKSNFASTYSRSNTEMESVSGLSGLSFEQVLDFADFKGGNSRTAFQRLATPSYARAFSIGVVDEDKVPWNRRSHAIREGTPYFLLSVESGRISFNEERREIDISAGTDFNVDMYYDTPDFLLLNNGMIARWRLRQDQPGQSRRALIQTKISEGIDSNGLKKARKSDVRYDGANTSETFRNNLHLSVQSGTNIARHSGDLELAKKEPLAEFRIIYTELLKRKLLPDLDGMKNVLLLNPQAVIFSKRARIHFDARNVRSDVGLEGKLTEILNAVNASIAADNPIKDELNKLAGKITDTASLLAEALPAAEVEFPGSTAGFDVQKLAQEMSANIHFVTTTSPYVGHSFFKRKRELIQEFSRKSAVLGATFDTSRRKLENAASQELARWLQLSMQDFFGSGRFSLIDTFDLSYGVLKSDFDQFTENQKLMIDQIPRDKIIFASLVSEVQIELGEVRPEVCFEKAQDENGKKMCSFILAQLNAMQKHISQLRGEEVLEMAERAGLSGRVKWESAEASKGENILRIARNMPAPLPILAPLPTP